MENAAVVETPAEEQHATLSPDGRWLAYAANGSGRTEVYVQRFPDPDTVHQISSEGGTFPRWSSDGRRLAPAAPRLGPFAPTLPVPARTGHAYLVAKRHHQSDLLGQRSLLWFEDPR